MPYSINYKRLYTVTALVSWFLLLINALFANHGSYPEVFAANAPLLGRIFKVSFIAFSFLTQRVSVDTYRGTDFIGYLWRLFLRAGTTAYVSALLYFGYFHYASRTSGDHSILLGTIYYINFAFLIYFLGKAFYIWRNMILFQKTRALQYEWQWFEIVIYATLLSNFFQLNLQSFVPLVGLFLLYTLFLCIHLRWVAYLTATKKWRSIFLLIGIVLSLVIFYNIFTYFSPEQQLTGNLFEDPFLVLTCTFVGMYTVASLLVAIFNLPTSSVFEQKREDLLNLQRLSQSIQQGEDEPQVYKLMFGSAIKASNADAAWLEVQDDTGTLSLIEAENIDLEEVKQIRQILDQYQVSTVEYVNNNLDQNTSFKSLNLPWRSLNVIPLRSQKRAYATLYLLKDVEQGFDRETLSVIRTFTSQTILTIENLRLVAESLQNERYKEELKIASSVQESLIPKTFPSDSWFEISCFSQAAKEVGGDFYDFLQVSESRIAIIIGDVSGKGITAAFHMAQMKGIFHGLMQDDLQPVEFMQKANNALTHCLERTSFITAALYIIDYKLKGFFFARAGHCHTLYYNSMTEETFYFNTEGLGLGIIRDKSYGKRIHNMHYDYNPGDVMIIYTDGIVEARSSSQDEYGEDRLREMLSTTYHLEADDIKAAIINDLNNFSGEYIHDDQTLIVIKFRNDQPNLIL
ncbi:GAF domain-containing SpoIIE family protein phosphatase [Adhaeribacter radiodurans]|uniref:SpoIIE family protein phosphatase n=1 Tax=Adhaeribacter radiodurans TaxID=2745197 RepID=A0A7L7L3F9_9BACT|nr:GAF domain-containing SpoIIE family protein phosphatase [Adhaeribacter radiodurans]QMU27300.1 SpoIIE family protein phosphatase [Adhaeribacter radiodurans]